MERNAVLVADQGMRILNPNGITTEAPYFLAVNDELWKAWREIQRQGEGATIGPWWRITSNHLPNGGSVMSLHVRFDPIEAQSK